MRSAAFLLFASFVVGVEAQDQTKDAPLPERIQFNRDIRPILSDSCMK